MHSFIPWLIGHALSNGSCILHYGLLQLEISLFRCRKHDGPVEHLNNISLWKKTLINPSICIVDYFKAPDLSLSPQLAVALHSSLVHERMHGQDIDMATR